jgi:glycerophosphoryl diester phosphodiesterase
MQIIKPICLIFILFLIIKLPHNIIPKKLISISDIYSNKKTIIESHRGINREIFENTLEAFWRALNYGIESLETDVWLSKDNVLVIYHGFGDKGDLEPLYNERGNITDKTWKELSSYRTKYDDLKMPKLKDVLILAKNRIFLNLEIKDPRADLVWPRLIKLIEKYDFFDQIALSSFHHEYYPKIEEYNNNHEKKLVFGFLYHQNEKSIFDYTKKGHSLNIYWTDATKEVCDKAHENGMAIQSWFKLTDVETTEIYKQLIKNGADIICCNSPLLAKKYRDSYYF